MITWNNDRIKEDDSVDDNYVVSVTDFDKKRKKVIFSSGLIILLYYGDLRTFHIEESSAVSGDTMKNIMSLLRKRAKERSMYILKRADKTEKMITDKLHNSYYPEEVISYVIDFLREYGYVNDKKYGIQYIIQQSKKKSFKQINIELRKKGISKELIEEITREDEDGLIPCDSIDTIKRLLKKRHYNPDITDVNEKRKCYGYLLNKGFSYDDIEDAMKDFDR